MSSEEPASQKKKKNRKKAVPEEEDEEVEFAPSEETSDSDGCLLSTRRALEYYRVMDMIRRNDPALKSAAEPLYNSEETGSSSDEGEASRASGKKPYTLLSQAKEKLDTLDLEHVDKLVQPEALDELDDGKKKDTPAAKVKAAREEFLAVASEFTDGNWDFAPKEETTEGRVMRQEEYEKWLATSQGKKVVRELRQQSQLKQQMERIWADADPKDKNEQFLREFFCNEGWLPRKQTSASSSGAAVAYEDAEKPDVSAAEPIQFRHQEAASAPATKTRYAEALASSVRRKKPLSARTRRKQRKRLHTEEARRRTTQ
eukprot:RCo036337